MTRPRIVDPGATLALSRRTTRRHFLRARRKAASAINACSVVGHPGLEPGANGFKNPSKASPFVTNGENTGDAQRPIATDQTLDAVSKPFRALSRSTLIASLYDHAAALAQAGDIAAARVAHEAAGRLLVVPEPANAVVDLNQRRKP
ncbi:MAG: hypothetical protein JRG70_09700 [Deltaproteobacteria bacterium]|nr:hypothetical protein [Deltaproteobacteria bacterium]